MPAHFSDSAGRTRRASRLTSIWTLRIAFALLLSIVLLLMLFGTSALSH